MEELNKDSEIVDLDLFQDYCDSIDQFDFRIEGLNRDEIDKLLGIEKLRFKERSFNYFYPLEKFLKLPKECQRAVKDASNNANEQFRIGVCSIEGIHNFPKDEEIGVNYLKCALRNKCKRAGIYLSRFFISHGIHKDYSQASFFLSQCVSDSDEDENSENYEKDSEYLYLRGKIEKKEGNIDDAKLSFKKSYKGGNKDAMYEYAKIIFIKEPEKAMQLFVESSHRDSNEKSKKFLSAHNYLKNIENII